MSSTVRTWRRAMPFKSPALVLALVGAMVVAGCGGSSGTQAAPADTSTPVPAAETTASETPSTEPMATGAATGDCGEATAVLIAQHLARPDVVSVTTEGGCRDALIITTLDASDWQTGLAICESAEETAYAGDIYSITVLAADETELAIGIKEASCIGEP